MTSTLNSLSESISILESTHYEHLETKMKTFVKNVNDMETKMSNLSAKEQQKVKLLDYYYFKTISIF